MATDISASTVKVVTSSGEKTYYSFDIVDPKTGQIKEAFNTTNPQEAKAFYDKTAAKYPSATTNGKSESPFEDGTFKAQTDYKVGGFAGPASEAGPDGQFNQDDIRDTVTPGSSTSGENASIPNSSKLTKLARDLSGMSKARRRKYERLSAKQKHDKQVLGTNGQKRPQAMAHRQDLKCEYVKRGIDNNAFIVIGNDRVEKAHSGYGGQAHTQCDSIDLVAGLGGHNPREVDSKERKVPTNPNFFVDAARIYISQKTNVDKNFGIGEFARASPEVYGVERAGEADLIGVYGAKSAIVTKADNIRVIGRESVRLVTGTDAYNSQGGEVLAKSGIELIAMNNVETLQPIVLGDNLQLALVTVLNNIEALAKITHGYIKYQMKYNQTLQQHTHNSPFYGITTLPSGPAISAGIKCDIETAANTELSILKHITNLQGVKHNFLTDSGESFINSRLNKVN
tara:strand:- start:945 stop:2309 length:1365 start_codon:yes stop_codon:yes gene_type:complete